MLYSPPVEASTKTEERVFFSSCWSSWQRSQTPATTPELTLTVDFDPDDDDAVLVALKAFATNMHE
eukprot:2512046-Pleurochrysis_carterae.AAC.1